MNLEYAQNAVTHSSRVRRKSETFLWTPPADFKGQVIMKLVITLLNFKVQRKLINNRVS